MPEAIELEWLPAFLLPKHPGAAKRAAQMILQGAKGCLTMQKSATMDDRSGRRELVTVFGAGSDVLRYLLADARVVFIRVFYSKEPGLA